MAHETEGFVIPESGARFLRQDILRCRIDSGFVFVAIPWEGTQPLCCPCAQHAAPAFPEFRRLTPKAFDVLEGLSFNTPLAYIETTYFGGSGDQAAMVLDKGNLRYGPLRERNGAINPALRRIGAPTAALADEFDTIGLWRYRTTHNWLAHSHHGHADASKPTPRDGLQPRATDSPGDKNRVYVVVDLEATCWKGCRVDEMEIIEIGAVCLDGKMFQPMSDFEQFVKPATRPVLTDFCRELTHIKQGQIDAGPPFAEAFGTFMEWIGDDPFRLCSWGAFDFDLFNCELNRNAMEWPPGFSGHLNLKELYARAYSTKPSMGLREAMRKLSMPFEGRPHRGIDDARNIARVAQTILMLDR